MSVIIYVMYVMLLFESLKMFTKKVMMHVMSLFESLKIF